MLCKYQKKLIYMGSKKAVRKYINVLDAAKVCVDLVKNKIKNIRNIQIGIGRFEFSC